MDSTPETPKDAATVDMSVAEIARELAELRRRYNLLAVALRDYRNTLDHVLRGDVIGAVRRRAIEPMICRIAAKVEGTTLTEAQAELQRTFEAEYDKAILKFGDDNPEISELLDVRSPEERGQAEG
jgi:hypothetical protein